MKKLVLTALVLAGCNTLPPQVLPPPFGPINTQDTHLFFPTGMAVTNDGALLVVNGNFNHAYDVGTVVGLDPGYVASFYTRLAPNGQHYDCGVAAPSQGAQFEPPNCDTCDCNVPAQAPAVMIGNYAGPITLDAAGATAFTGSRDTGVLNAVAVGRNGTLGCAAGTGTSPDCRNGLVNLETAANIDGPFTIVPGDFIPPGQSTPHPVFYVDSVVPHIESIISGIITTSSQVAALDMANPANVLFTIPVASQFIANGWAPGPMVFDGARRKLFLSGCYQRFPGTGAGEPGSGKCGFVGANYLRVVDVDAQSSASVQLYNLYPDLRSNETTQLLLADVDPATQMPATLWATMRNPDTLVQIDLPLTYSVEPRIRRAVPLPVSPADMLRIPRPGASDLIVVVAEKIGAVAIYDVGLGQVVAVVQRLGESPFGLTQVPCPASAAGSACLAASVFNECRVAFVEVPLSQPSASVLRGRAGGCL